MARKANCTIDSKLQKDSQRIVNKVSKDVELQIDSLIDDDFGVEFTDIDSYQNDIDNFTLKRRELQSKLKIAQKNKEGSKVTVPLKNKIIQAEKSRDNAVKLLKEQKRKTKFINEIRTLLKERLHQSAFKSGYTLDTTAVVDAIKTFLVEKTGTPFVGLGDLEASTLSVKLSLLKKWFKEQDKGIVPNIFGKGVKGLINKLVSAYDYTLADSAKVILMRDKSLGGIPMIKKILTVLARRSADTTKWTDIYRGIQKDLDNIIYQQNILYFPDKKNQPVDINNLTQEEKIENNNNILKLQTNLMDGRTRYIRPQPLDAKFFKNKKLADAYDAVVSYANRSGFNISKDIIELTVGEDTFYYFTQKNTDRETGVEIYDAYIIPHYVNENKQTEFIYPLTKDKKFFNKKFRIAVDKMKKENMDLPDLMVEGFREAQKDKLFNGFNKNQDEINVKGYADFVPIDLKLDDPLLKRYTLFPNTRSQKITSFWLNIQSQREMYKQLFDIFQKRSKSILERIQLSTKKFPQLTAVLSQKNINPESILSNLSQLIDLGNALYIDENGEIQTNNISTGQKENYHPDMYEESVYLTALQKSINDLKEESKLIQDRIVQLKAKKLLTQDPDEIDSINSKIIRNEERYIRYNGDVDGDLKGSPGLIALQEQELDEQLSANFTDKDSVNAQNMIVYAKHKKLFTNRIMPPNAKKGGKRFDAQVATDYINNLFNTLHNNDLKAALMETAFIVEPGILNYLIEETKAALGRKDLDAGLPFLNYSDKSLEKLGNKFGFSTERLRHFIRNSNIMMSGTLLGMGVGFTNRMQSIMGSIIEVGMVNEAKVIDLYNNNPDLVQEIASKSGAVDSVQAIADLFLGSLEAGVTFIDGLLSTKDLLLLKGQDMASFTKSANGLRRYFIKMVKRREGSQATIAADELDDLLNGTFEIVHGIAEKTLTDKQLKQLEKRFSRVAIDGQVRIYATWGMSAMGSRNMLTEAQGISPYFELIEGEKQMRTIVALRAAVHYADTMAGGDMRGNYTHPAAIEHARITINNTMFQFSLQHFPKAFRGAVGQTITKFKGYWLKESQTEWRIISNFFKQFKDKSRSEVFDEIKKVFTPTRNMPLPYLREFFGYDANDVGGFNLKQNGPFPWMKFKYTKTIGTDRPTEQLRQLMFSRMLSSFFTTFVFVHWRFIQNLATAFVPSLSRKTLFQLGRGAESTLASLGFRLAQVMLGIQHMVRDDDGEEEDRNKLELYRLFMPVMYNVIADTIKDGDPTKVLGVYSGLFRNGADFIDSWRGSD